MSNAKRKPATMPKAEPKVVTAEELLGFLRRPKPMPVDVPGLGRILVQQLTVGEHDEIVDLATQRDADGKAILGPNGQPIVDMDKRAELTLIAQVAEPALTPELLGSLDEMGLNPFVVLRAAISSVQGLSAEEAEARFPARP